jgi:nucleoside-diphosphate-sugar epimerase
MSTTSHLTQSLAGKRVLVTGASGFLGSHLVERLTQEGATVGALSRTVGKLALIEDPAAYSFIPCDLTDARQTTQAVLDFAPQVAFHLAGCADAREDFSQAAASVQSNLTGVLNLLEAFRQCSGELFVYGDSCKVYGNGEVPYRGAMATRPNSSYAITKAAAWEFCTLYASLYGLPAVAVRPTLIYGPRQSYNLINFVVDCVLAQRSEIRLDGGTQTRDPLFVSDAINAFVAVAGVGGGLAGRIINIGGGLELSVRELAATIVELMGKRLPVVSVPGHARPTEIWRSYCDNVEAAEMLDWRPATNLHRGLEATIQSLVESQVKIGSAESWQLSGRGQ